MKNSKQKTNENRKSGVLNKAYSFLAGRPYSVILIAALIYNVSYKFFWADRLDMISEYWKWILTDIAVLLGIEAVFVIICYRWRRRRVIRTVTVAAAFICTWSVINAAWVRRTGTQVLPHVLLPLFRSPVNSFAIIGGNLAKMPSSAVILLGTSAVLLFFFFYVIAKPVFADYKRKILLPRIILSCVIVLSAVIARGLTDHQNPSRMVAAGLRSNCHLRALVSLFASKAGRLTQADFAKAKRKIPRFDKIPPTVVPAGSNFKHNIVIIVLEGVQRQYTSLKNKEADRTPFIASLARQGIEFTNARCTMTHTTKSLFSLLTGRLPSLSQDIAEAVPVTKPYMSLATILKEKLNYRTAFFQSAKGNFECRPALVHNLGFEKFWAREELKNTDAYVGYLGCDEFAMLEPVTEWIDNKPGSFLLTIMCSVSHDPYVVPEWFQESQKEPLDRYFQTIRYTDRFISALDIELAKRKLNDKTIFCVIGDHGEAFGEHGLWGHERIAYDETLQIPAVIRCPGLIVGAKKISEAVSSIDITPTLLTLIGADVNSCGFDGKNALAAPQKNRKVFFAGWLEQSPMGFVQGRYKYVYNPTSKSALCFNLSQDPCELNAIPLSREQAEALQLELEDFRRKTLFELEKEGGKKWLYGKWKCRWTGRFSSAKYKRITEK